MTIIRRIFIGLAVAALVLNVGAAGAVSYTYTSFQYPGTNASEDVTLPTASTIPARLWGTTRQVCLHFHRHMVFLRWAIPSLQLITLVRYSTRPPRN